ncbi:MAG: methenyltetrahydromethanopterin cyclohydrolase [Clostridia bacterium]
MISVNKNTIAKVEYLIEHAEALGCKYYVLENGTKVVDMGIACRGGWEAARLFTEIDMACLGTCTYGNHDLGEGLSVPTVKIHVDNVQLGCLLSQIAGLKLTDGAFAAIGSGPARALAADKSDHCFEYHAYRDQSDIAILGLQMEVQPDIALANKAAEVCKVKPENLYLLVHATTSMVATVQVSARIIEQTVNKMIAKGFNLDNIVFARGWCVVSPVVNNELDAMGKINDALLYGGESDFWVECEDAEIEEVIGKLVTEHAKDYGRLFVDMFVEADKNFYNMDLDIHSPAKVQIYNMKTGNVFRAGAIRNDIIIKSFFNNHK